jgi:hypothetical protein
MESPQFIRAKLANQLQADCSDQRVENNRYIYSLRFEEDIGWDWAYTQVRKVDSDIDRAIEPWKICPSGMHDFEIEVREVAQREGIDDNQRGLTDFE